MKTSKMNILPKFFMGENSMNVAYNPTTHEHFRGETIMPWPKFSFSCIQISFSWVKFSCADFFTHETFCRGSVIFELLELYGFANKQLVRGEKITPFEST